MTVVRLPDARDESRFGGKAVELAAALRGGLPVPDGLAVSCDSVEQLVERGRDSTSLLEHTQELDGPYVVRSSGIGEDSTEASFAGQHRTMVNVTTPGGVIDAIGRVFESAHEEGVIAYRADMGIDEPPKIGVVVQTLIDADKSGVLFSRNPVDGSTERVIEASWGLGEAVVDSMITPDNIRMAPGGEILERRVGSKEVYVTPDPDGGTVTQPVPSGKRDRLCLNQEELRALDNLAKRCEDYRSGGHDIEWAIADEELFLLQRRDITTAV